MCAFEINAGLAPQNQRQVIQKDCNEKGHISQGDLAPILVVIVHPNPGIETHKTRRLLEESEAIFRDN
jgi:hypothetical protein